MALRSIRTEGDEVLRKISKRVEVFDRRLEMLIEDMWDTMYDAPGVGLAAVQVGVLKRVIVIDTGEENEKVVLINPEIMEEKGELCEPEGCLSIPGKSGTVRRPETVIVAALNEKGEPFVLEAHGFFAKACCHEIDHLQGVLYSDKVEEWLEPGPQS